jgi:hypothetical protein
MFFFLFSFPLWQRKKKKKKKNKKDGVDVCGISASLYNFSSGHCHHHTTASGVVVAVIELFLYRQHCWMLETPVKAYATKLFVKVTPSKRKPVIVSFSSPPLVGVAAVGCCCITTAAAAAAAAAAIAGSSRERK